MLTRSRNPDTGWLIPGSRPSIRNATTRAKVRPTAWLVLVLSCGLLGGCADDAAVADAGVDGAVDGTVDGSVAQGRLVLGTGGIDQFTEVNENDTVLLARGCQGGQHVWVGLRAFDLNTAPALIQMDATRVRDGEMLSVPFQVRLTFDEVAGETYTELTGLQLIIPSPDEVLNEDMRIFVRLSETRGDQIVDIERNVRIEWGPEVCGENAPG
ncbi:MAG: hypothetical protein AAGF12_13770 [Myxococcota bacterium]